MACSSKKLGVLKIPLFIILFALYGCQPEAGQLSGGPPLKLSLAVSPATYSALVAIADEKGFFREAGLEVSMNLYPSGKMALEAVCRKEAQAATVADIAFSAKAFEDSSIRILASISTTAGSQIVARKDKNIHKPSDLRGKRVGYTSGTVSDYFLYAFLITESIPTKYITAVDIPSDRQVESIINGEVDAVSAFEMFAFEAKEKLGKNAVSWNSQNNLGYHWLIATSKSFIKSPEPLKRLIKALIMAEDFVIHNEEPAKKILAHHWGFDSKFVEYSWPETRLNVSFSQSMVISLQNYTRWQMSKEGIFTDPPNVLNYLHTEILDEAAPGLVSIFR